MERTDSGKNHHDPGQDTPRLWSSFGAGPSSPAQSDASSQEVGGNNHIPVFLDRTFRMVEEVPDDVVCWSTAGDSFIIKQVLVLEEILPSYFNHKKFMSFVRQLNFYGFKKTKGRSRISSRSKSTNNRDTYGGGTAAAAAATLTDSESWEEFRHPQFHRGRRDLLVGIKRQKDGGRMKRKRAAADVQKSDIMSSLVTDVGTVNGELKAVKSKLDSIMSLLFNMGSVKSHAAPSNNPVPQSQNSDDAAAAAAAASGEWGGGVRFGGGGDTACFIHAAEPQTLTARGGYGQWLVGEGSGGGGGGTRRGGHDSYARGALLDFRTTPRLPPVDHRQGHLFHSELPQQASAAERNPVVPNQTRHHVVQPQQLPHLGAAVAARASESTTIGPSRHQLPPLNLSPSRVSESAASPPSSSSERMQGGDGTYNSPPRSRPPHRRDGSGGGVGTSPFYSASASGDPHGAQPPQLRASHQPQHNRETAGSVVPPPPPTGVGQRGKKVVSQMQQGLSDGTISMLQVLSESAVAAETEKERANSINSSSTQSSFEYD